jgi:hypothetical protein
MAEREPKRRKVGSSSTSSTSSSSRGGGSATAAATTTTFLAVAASAAGHLIGKGGAAIEEIRRASGAEIDVAKPSDEPSGHVSRIVGPAPRDGEGLVEVVVSGSAHAVRVALPLVTEAASRTGRRRKPPADGDAGELADIFDHEDDGGFEQPAQLEEDGAYPATDTQFERAGGADAEQQDAPAGTAAAPADAVAAAVEGLLPGWAKGWDPQREQVYYWHAATQTSSWTLPSPAAAAAAAAAAADSAAGAGGGAASSLAGLVGGYASSSSSSSEEDEG